jgi:hypothetical protein
MLWHIARSSARAGGRQGFFGFFLLLLLMLLLLLGCMIRAGRLHVLHVLPVADCVRCGQHACAAWVVAGSEVQQRVEGRQVEWWSSCSPLGQHSGTVRAAIRAVPDDN